MRAFLSPAHHRYVCHGKGCNAPARYEVQTQAHHAYCRDCLPLRYRPLVGLGTVVEKINFAA